MAVINDNVHDRTTLCSDVYDWFEQPLGQAIQACEALQLRQVLANLFGTLALQVGRPGSRDLLEPSVIPTKAYLDIHRDPARNLVMGLPEALPFDTKSVDVILLPHTLDFSPDPARVLREVHRVLTPEGHVVILGFNPFSLWGMWRILARRSGKVPWCGQFLSLLRLRDWLSLLDCEVTEGSMLFYRPPVNNERIMDRLFFLDKMGDRWWSLAAGVYLLVAKKRMLGVTPIRPQWKKNRAANNAASQTATRGMTQRG